jgi:hypothetical protein
MTWNYRVIRGKDGDEFYYAIHECFYDKKEDTIPHSWAETPEAAIGETREELIKDLVLMIKAVTKPVLEIQGEKLVEVEPVLQEEKI